MGKPTAAQAMKKDIGEIKTQVSEVTNTVNSVVDAVNTLAQTVGSMAKNNIVLTNKHLDGEEQFMGDEGTARIVDAPDGSPIMQVPEGTYVDDPLFNDKMKMLQFNEQLIEVDIHAPPDEQMPEVFEVSVSGVTQIFRHNTRVRVARKFVEGLARAKPSTFGNVEQNNAQTGEKEYVYPVRKGLKYGFGLVNPTKQDSDWIRSIMAQP